jgi:hypothetical protein
MNEQEKLIHAAAFDAARRVEELLAIPRRERALRFFELFQLLKRGLEEFCVRNGTAALPCRTRRELRTIYESLMRKEQECRTTKKAST